MSAGKGQIPFPTPALAALSSRSCRCPLLHCATTGLFPERLLDHHAVFDTLCSRFLTCGGDRRLIPRRPAVARRISHVSLTCLRAEKAAELGTADGRPCSHLLDGGNLERLCTRQLYLGYSLFLEVKRLCTSPTYLGYSIFLKIRIAFSPSSKWLRPREGMRKVILPIHCCRAA